MESSSVSTEQCKMINRSSLALGGRRAAEPWNFWKGKGIDSDWARRQAVRQPDIKLTTQPLFPVPCLRFLLLIIELTCQQPIRTEDSHNPII